MSTYDQAHFESLYEKDIDPWKFCSSPYEAAKYRATMDALPAGRFSKCLELGCSIGVLTKELAQRCDYVVGLDTSSHALEAAAQRCHGLNVRFIQAHLPEGVLGTGYDLVVASEVLYFMNAPDVRTLAQRLADAVSPNALCVGVHWTGPTDYPLSAKEASETLEAAAQLERVEQVETEHYRLDVWRFSTGRKPSFIQSSSPDPSAS